MYYDVAVGPICVTFPYVSELDECVTFTHLFVWVLLDFIVFVILRGGVGYLGSIYI